MPVVEPRPRASLPVVASSMYLSIHWLKVGSLIALSAGSPQSTRSPRYRHRVPYEPTRTRQSSKHQPTVRSCSRKHCREVVAQSVRRRHVTHPWIRHKKPSGELEIVERVKLEKHSIKSLDWPEFRELHEGKSERAEGRKRYDFSEDDPACNGRHRLTLARGNCLREFICERDTAVAAEGFRQGGAIFGANDAICHAALDEVFRDASPKQSGPEVDDRVSCDPPACASPKGDSQTAVSRFRLSI